MKLVYKIASVLAILCIGFCFSSCKKDKLLTDASAKVSFSDEKVLFDTVFTSIGSSTRNIRVRNKNNQKIKISSISLKGGSSSQFIVNVDGAKGLYFEDIEIAANDSIYIFIQVNVNPNNANSPLIISDELDFTVNGNQQVLTLEAWGQDAYYHKPTNALKFKDGSYLAYSLISSNPNVDTVWKKDKPHVIYGYLVVDSAQKLTIQAGVQVFMNYKAGLWVYRYGQIKIQGQKGNEVVFQGARREKDFADEPGQWDRIWINEGSDFNEINYAIIKNGYIGVQAELFGNTLGLPGKLKLTNTKIQNMSMWGLYCLAYNVSGGNNVVSNCQEHSLNIALGGTYNFAFCTFANFWNKDKAREKPTVNINNYSTQQVLPLTVNFYNSIIDGKRDNELNLDIKAAATASDNAVYTFNYSWLKTSASVLSNRAVYNDVRTGTTSLLYCDAENYNFAPKTDEKRIQAFVGAGANSNLLTYGTDISGFTRNSTLNGGVTAGAYEIK